MKKIIISSLIVISLMFLTSCGQKTSNDNSSYSESQKTENKSEEESIREKDKYSEEEYKSMCEELDYKSLARNPDSNFGKKVHAIGEIVQVVEESNDEAIFRINITPVMSHDNKEVLYYEDTIMVYTFDYDMNNRLLEDDVIEFWGIAGGNYTYETVLGSEQTIPSVQMDYYTLK